MKMWRKVYGRIPRYTVGSFLKSLLFIVILIVVISVVKNYPEYSVLSIGIAGILVVGYWTLTSANEREGVL